LSLLFFQLRIQEDQFIIADETIDDPILIGAKQSIWITDANFGVFYTAQNYYAGYSTIHLFNSAAMLGEEGDGEYKLVRQHNLIAGYRYIINSKFALEPSALLKIPESGITQFDLNVKCTYDAKYWGGVNYRTKSTICFFGGLNYERYYFGYSFDYKMGDKLPNTYGSHEFIVSARFGDSARRYKWLNSY
jgi:type IX secretion system PorP/SprF family membrane protein